MLLLVAPPACCLPPSLAVLADNEGIGFNGQPVTYAGAKGAPLDVSSCCVALPGVQHCIQCNAGMQPQSLFGACVPQPGSYWACRILLPACRVEPLHPLLPVAKIFSVAGALSLPPSAPKGYYLNGILTDGSTPVSRRSHMRGAG